MLANSDDLGGLHCVGDAFIGAMSLVHLPLLVCESAESMHNAKGFLCVHEFGLNRPPCTHVYNHVASFTQSLGCKVADLRAQVQALTRRAVVTGAPFGPSRDEPSPASSLNCVMCAQVRHACQHMNHTCSRKDMRAHTYIHTHACIHARIYTYIHTHSLSIHIHTY